MFCRISRSSILSCTSNTPARSRGDWNTQDPASGYAGFVTRFHVDDEFARRYPVRIAGSSHHEELWVPAEELDDFNHHLDGRIEVIESYAGANYTGRMDPATHLPAALPHGK